MKRLLRIISLPLLALVLWISGSDIAARSADLASLRAEVLGLIQGTGWTNSEWGVLAVSLEQGDTLFALDPDRRLAPASNQKLFTSAAALHHLGPDYRFPTFLLTDGEVSEGVLHGDLILYGTGDPAISGKILDSATVAWRTFASVLKDAGVRSVSGDIVADESFFRGPSRSPSWSERYLDDWYAAPISALTFAENVVTIHMQGGAPGSPARVRVDPAGARLPIINTSVSVGGDVRRSLFLGRDGPDGAIRLEGRIGTASGELSRVLTVPDPARVAASVFLSVLEEEGIQVHGRITQVRSEEASSLTSGSVFAPALMSGTGSKIRTLAVHYSPPLHELIRVLNKESHNLYAEILLFTLGRVTSGDGSFSEGSRALGDYLTTVVGVREEAFHIEDGSGLSAMNRASPSAFIDLLRHVADSEYAEPFWASLPEAGNRRELRRMYQSAAAGNLRAKTGTIRRVSALSGIVQTADGESVLFSILSNNVPSSSRAKRIEDGIGIELASFSRPSTPALAD